MTLTNFSLCLPRRPLFHWLAQFYLYSCFESWKEPSSSSRPAFLLFIFHVLLSLTALIIISLHEKFGTMPSNFSLCICPFHHNSLSSPPSTTNSTLSSCMETFEWLNVSLSFCPVVSLHNVNIVLPHFLASILQQLTQLNLPSWELLNTCISLSLPCCLWICKHSTYGGKYKF